MTTIRDFIDSYLEFEARVTTDRDGVEWVAVPHTTHGDYVGAAVEKANYLTLQDEVESLIDNYRADEHHGEGVSWTRTDWSTEYLEIRADVPVPEDWESWDDTETEPDWFEALGRLIAQAVSNLAAYPCLDEQRVSEVEQQVITEAWEEYGRDDLRRTAGVDDERLTDAEADDLMQRYYADAPEGPVVETGMNVCFDTDKIAALLPWEKRAEVLDLDPSAVTVSSLHSLVEWEDKHATPLADFIAEITAAISRGEHVRVLYGKE